VTGPQRQYTRLDALRYFLSHDDPVFVAGELESEAPVSKTVVRRRLVELHDDGLLGRKKPTEHTTLYWITDAGQQYYFDNCE
jgi:DNA-binding HxlR family transcriptional regulator